MQIESFIAYFLRVYRERYDIPKTHVKALGDFAQFVNDQIRDNPPSLIQPGKIIFADGNEVVLGPEQYMDNHNASISVFGTSRREGQRQEMAVDRTPAIQMFPE